MLSPKSTERDCQLILDGNLSYSTVNSSKDFISGNYKTETTYDAVSTRNIDVNQVYWKGKNEYDEIQESSKLSQGEISFARSGHVILGGQKDNHTPIPNISKEHDLNVEVILLTVLLQACRLVNMPWLELVIPALETEAYLMYL